MLSASGIRLVHKPFLNAGDLSGDVCEVQDPRLDLKDRANLNQGLESAILAARFVVASTFLAHQRQQDATRH